MVSVRAALAARIGPTAITADCVSLSLSGPGLGAQAFGPLLLAPCEPAGQRLT